MFGKKRNEFKLPYLGIENQIHGFHCLFNLKGDFGVILRLDNPVLQYSADSSKYDSFHQLYTNLIKILGEGHLIQKQDIFSRKTYSEKFSTEYLQRKYDDHFQGR
nr:conjugal transfer protein TraG [Algoriphagus sp.]